MKACRNILGGFVFVAFTNHRGHKVLNQRGTFEAVIVKDSQLIYSSIIGSSMASYSSVYHSFCSICWGFLIYWLQYLDKQSFLKMERVLLLGGFVIICASWVLLIWSDKQWQILCIVRYINFFILFLKSSLSFILEFIFFKPFVGN